MEKARLSKMYGKACARLQQAGSELYESLHTESGDPITDVHTATEKLTVYKKWLLMEVDFIRELVREYGEINGSESE